ncbi:MAG: efflux RND transporter periplasmic adaptor subunit [Desulfobacula sp.]|jgi:membrane fusion protein, multidrug efflux system|uniref:efflux RND transporter periplasmic adaptor subunit n=1 Tax=Desulfobacula sp. TaxID=2593537 RepID=UPI001DDB0CA9|nr:efflux RND transporter periplasmic adaptor subunit [Desulfobacula sp.]MBT3486315.1 efflux RND transporter periplasmic adaptor subunit [Desulfobacula sp.]MBT3805279.1 efflux RND transporter periplasmic adaptor subunit [Desulfobacula sp.]MBT4026126.1 efflux RND transporter periplasmic adaptor subunit [Desulfobacula sp.]MBT4198047.1 efflux RND transporter periplasmic adaptor subunit [Desulfobacula sp.]
MKNLIIRYLKRLLIILPIVAAVSVVAYLLMHRANPVKKPVGESIRTLRTIKAPQVELVPRAKGYGVAEPGQVWEAVAEVRGTVLSIHPRLKSGELIDAKSVLIQIDPTEYELAVARLEANIEETRANINKLAADKENTKQLLAIEKRSIALAQKLLERKQMLAKRNAISFDEVDREEKLFLQQKQIVQQFENILSLIPSQQKALNATLAALHADLKLTKINLSKTVIMAPFDCRLSDLSIEVGQFVNANQPLFKTHSTAVNNIEARFQIEELRNIISEQKREKFKSVIDADAIKQLFVDVTVLLRLKNKDGSTQWKARIDRIREMVDSQTREIRVVVAVDRPYEQAVPGEHPVLMPGMFCEVELQGQVRPKSIVLPRSAVYENFVFIVDEQDRLNKKQVAVDFIQSEFVVIKSGLSGNEIVVVSDPSPAIIGMKVSAISDDALRQRLLDISQATGVIQ